MTTPAEAGPRLLVRAANRTTGEIHIGIAEGGTVQLLPEVPDIGSLLGHHLATIRSIIDADDGPRHRLDDYRLLPPIDGDTEVWAAGVTYESSRLARMEESGTRDVYQMVYDAPRPELFFKSHPWKATTDGELVARRRDPENDVPEPELALILNSYQEIVGYAAANDMSSRSIEGANPLYLPQAKVYAGSFAISPGIRPAWEIDEPYALTIEMQIVRNHEVIFDGSASTSQLHRRFETLVEHLFRHQSFPAGAVLSTGTCVVPPLALPTLAGDTVTITIADVGSLTNTVSDDPAIGSWLASRRHDPLNVFGH